jgi:ATP-dependent DNA helicase RecG
VLTLQGIGPALAQRLADKRIATIEDLAWLVPRRYDDLRNVKTLAEALAAPLASRVTFAATIAGVRGSSWRRFLEVTLVEGEARLVARWFNVRGKTMGRRFVKDGRIVLSGILREHNGVATIANPEILGHPDDDAATTRAAIMPRYPQVEGVAPAILRRICRLAAARAGPHLVDGLPGGAAARHALPDLAEALARLHEPPGDLDDAGVDALCRGESLWHRRLAFDELFFVALAVARRRALRQGAVAPACRAPPEVAALLDRVFPFALTGAQRRAVDTLTEELARERPMNRLLQGDVGSGKTAVAFAAAHSVMASRRQVAIMAPTELLAEQHLSTLRPWAEAVGKRCALLTASTPRAVRETLLGMLAAGAIDLLVGHPLSAR